MNVYDIIVIFLYSLGLASWLFIWFGTGSVSLLPKNKLLYFPFLLIPVVFILEIIFFLWEPIVGTFQAEEALVVVIERNNHQLITATFGIIVLAATLFAVKLIRHIEREFLFFVALSLICSVGGVLTLYWLPTSNAAAYFVLRHFKTIPYTYSIGFFLTGLIILLQDILEAEKIELERRQKK